MVSITTIFSLKEFPVPSAHPAQKSDLDTLLDQILDELGSRADSRRLNEVRSLFRRKIPLHLRSYAAALLLDWQLLKPEDKKKSSPSRGGKKESGSPEKKPERQVRHAPESRGPSAKVLAEKAEEAARPRLRGESVTLFFGMGKRQRLYPRVLLHLLQEQAGLAPEEIGELRSFDNYSFADVAPLRADQAIEALEGYAWRGRSLPVSRAKRKAGEPAPILAAVPKEGEQERNTDLSE